MKKIIFTISITLYGCSDIMTHTENMPRVNDLPMDSGARVYKIEGCEYIGRVYNGHGDFLTHKGNCTNPIHKP
jgi:hypothetical protein